MAGPEFNPADEMPLSKEDYEAWEADVIGGFPYAEPNCKSCGQPLLLENAWMTDGCPCNHVLGVNSMNETRWRLLLMLHQHAIVALTNEVKDTAKALVTAERERDEVRSVADSIRSRLEKIVCTKDPDRGVVLLSSDGPSHFDRVLDCTVYDHEHFSPLGDALIDLYELVTAARGGIPGIEPRGA